MGFFKLDKSPVSTTIRFLNKKIENKMRKKYTIKRILIDMTSMTIIAVIIVLVMFPFNEITFKHFFGLLGVFGYLIIRLIIDRFFAKKELKK